MRFDEGSEVSLVLTSCGRFDLLKRALDSFDRYNSYPIRSVLITEDSGSKAVHACIPPGWVAHTRVFVNRPRLGQHASVDLAYSQVATPYVFHMEDDWECYRGGFIEDSKLGLESAPRILQVWLRSFAHDLRVHYSIYERGERREQGTVRYYPVVSFKPGWQGFSLNPGLRRLCDYRAVAPFARFADEAALANEYAKLGFGAAILEADAILHTGSNQSVYGAERRLRRQQRKRLRFMLTAVSLLGAFLVGDLAA